MSKRSIETARDADLRLSWQAMLRAAQRARDLAVHTGTTIVVSQSGIIGQISTKTGMIRQAVREPRDTADS